LIRGTSLDFLFKTPFVSSAIASFCGCRANFFFMLCLRRADGVEAAGVPGAGAAPSALATVGGACPFLTGVEGGRVLSMYSGEMYGPNETRFDPGVSAEVAAAAAATTTPALGGDFSPLDLLVGLSTLGVFLGDFSSAVMWTDLGGYSHLKERSPRVTIDLCFNTVTLFGFNGSPSTFVWSLASFRHTN